MPVLNISAIPAFRDNYIWLIRTGGTSCAVVDPGEAAPVVARLQHEGLQLRYILLTHHHPDHIGGAAELVKRYGAEVFGPDDPRVSLGHQVMKEGSTAHLPELELDFSVLEVPGHTSSHIVFIGHGCLFSGDTLFSVGCGRLFEGTPEQMQTSLDKLAALPSDTRVYCGHEYTRSNCEFALQVEPENERLRDKASEVTDLRSRGEITLPGMLGEELAVNPFMRSRQETVVRAAQKRNPEAAPGASTLAEIRQWKDGW